MSVVEQIEARRDLDQRIERELATPLEVMLPPEQMQGDEAINKLLILGLTGRRWRSMLQTRWDTRELHGQPLQEMSLEILDGVIAAGAERLTGDFLTHTPDHSVYDQLFDRLADTPDTSEKATPHAIFLEKLSNIAMVSQRLLEEPDTYEPTLSERLKFKAMQERFVRVSEKLFRDMFFTYANSEVVPVKYQNLLEETIDPELAGMFMSRGHWMDKYIQMRNLEPINLAVSQEARFLYWVVTEGEQLRAQRFGHFLRLRA